jgi:hypothetical protein
LSPHPILTMIAKRRSERAIKIADAICLLVIDGRPPARAALDRLVVAAKRGAFERYEVDEIVRRILHTEIA